MCLTSDDNDDDDGDDYNDDDGDDDNTEDANDDDDAAVDAAADHTKDLLQKHWGVSLILSRYLHKGGKGISSRV